MRLPERRRGRERRAQVDPLRGGEQLDRDDAGAVGGHVGEPAGGKRRHADVVFLVRRGRQAVDARRVRERLVLARERGRRHLRDHEAGIHPAVLDQERRQPRKRGVDEERDAALGKRPGLRDCHCERVRHERHRLGVEVASGEDLIAAGEDERIVGDRVRLGLEHARGVAHLIEARSHHLGLAAQAVGVLYARVVFQMRAADRAPREELGVAGGNVALPRMRPQRVDARIERRVAPRGGVDRHAAGDHRRGEHVLGREQPRKRKGGGDLRAVEQREALLGREPDRIGQTDLADAHQCEREMRERREIARGADRSFRRDARIDALVVHPQQRVHRLRANAGSARGEARDLERENEPRRRVVDRRAGSGGVREHDVGLELFQLAGRDAGLREAAEARVHAVGRLARGDDPLDQRGPGAQPRQAGGIELERDRFARDPAQVGKPQGRAADADHRSIGRSSPFSLAQAIASS